MEKAALYVLVGDKLIRKSAIIPFERTKELENCHSQNSDMWQFEESVIISGPSDKLLLSLPAPVPKELEVKIL